MDRLLLALCLLLAACGARSAREPRGTRPAEPATHLALLVGIDRYPRDAGVGELRGAVRDAERVRALLVGRFGFRDEDVVVLRDESATHEAIVRSFAEHLIERSRLGTEVVFYFAGHGSRVPDDDLGPDREADGLDTSFLAYDSRTSGRVGEHDLVDDELRSLVAAASARGALVTVIVDACHAGGALRGGTSFRPRTAPQGNRPLDRRGIERFWPLGVPYQGDSERVVLGSVVSIGAASRDQVAGEIDVETVVGAFEPAGAMTWTLAQRLEGARPGATWGEIANQTALGVATLLPHQDVVWVGDVDRAVFGGSFAAVSGWRAAVLDADSVLVEAGWIHGLRAGSELEIRAADGRQVFARALVDHIAPVQARARYVQRPRADVARLTLRAVEVGRPAGEPPLRLACEVAGLEPWFANSPWVTTVSSLASADLVVRSGAGGYQVWTPEGLCLPGHLPILPPTWSDQARWLAACEPLLRRESLWRATSRLALEAGGIELDVRLDTPSAEDLRAPVPAGWSRWIPAVLHDRRVVGGAAGELPMGVFRVRNPGRAAVRLSVLNLSEDARARRVIEPSAGRDPRLLGPGESCSIRVGFPAPERWSLERPMLDRYLFLATFVPFDAWTLVSDVELRGDESPLPGILRQAQASYAQRGAGPVDLDRSGLGLAAIDVLVSPRR